MRVPLPTALTILGAAFVVSYLIATSDEPLTIKRYPEEPERNYTLETLRTLRGQPTHDAVFYATGMYWPNGDREYARIRYSTMTTINGQGNP